MKKAAKYFLATVGVVLGLILVGLLITVAPAFIGNKPIADGFEINGVRIVKDGSVSMSVLDIGNREVAFIDAGNDRSGKAILAELSRRGLGADAVRAILLTHGHNDHLGAVRLFPHAQVMVLEADVALAEGRAKGLGPLTRMLPSRPTGIKITRVLKDGETVTVGNVPVRVYSIPGHTAGSAAFLANGVLFLGDSAYAKKDGTLRGAIWAFSDSTDQNRTSLSRLERVLKAENADVKAIFFAHTGPLANGLAPLTEFVKKN